jgi:hypothetical protein
MIYCTTLGGSGVDYATGVAVDSAGNAYVTGQTDSIGFPTAYAFQPNKDAVGQYDAFVARIVDSGLSLSTTKLDLGDIPLGKSKTQSLTLTNTGGADLTVNYVGRKPTGDSSLCGAFTLSHAQLPLTIPAGGNGKIDVTFAPGADQDYDCLLQVGSNSPTQALGQVSLVGIGSGLVSVSVEYTYVIAGRDAEFDLKFTNPLSTVLQFDFYFFIIFPNGQQALMTSAPFSLPPDRAVKIEGLKLPISRAAPLGKYTLQAVAARSGAGIIAVDSASFTVHDYPY